MLDFCQSRLHRLGRTEGKRPVILEICAAGLDDCLTAQAHGADRVELNSALTLGGLTPSLGLLEEVRRRTRLQIIAMIRPRDGGFAYSESELDVMERDIALALKAGADGFALGVLNADRTVNVVACRRLVNAMKGRTAVFHRAFDLVPDPFAAMEILISLGFKRILTSGQKPTALEGAALIRDLIQKADGRIEILPGAGVSEHNVVKLLEATGADQVHASLSGEQVDATLDASDPLGFRAAPLPGDQYKATQGERVSALRAALDRIDS